MSLHLLPGDWLNWTLELVMLFKKVPFICETLLRQDWVFHKHKGDLAYQVIRYLLRLFDLSDSILNSLGDLPYYTFTFLCCY